MMKCHASAMPGVGTSLCGGANCSCVFQIETIFFTPSHSASVAASEIYVHAEYFGSISKRIKLMFGCDLTNWIIAVLVPYLTW